MSEGEAVGSWRISRLLRAQLDAPDPVPDFLHRQVWARLRAASVRDDDAQELFAALVRRTDTPADLIERYRTITHPPVRAAFLCRPHLPETIVRAEIAGENRAATLAAIFDLGAKKPLIVECVGARLLDRPARTLALALLAEPGVHEPDVQAAIVAAVHPAAEKLTRTQRSNLTSLLTALAKSGGLPARAAAATVAGDAKLGPLFAGTPGLPAETRRRIITAVAEHETSTSTVAVTEAMFNAGDLQPELHDLIVTTLRSSDRHTAADKMLMRFTEPAGSSLEERIARARSGDDTEAVALILDPRVPDDVRAELAGRASVPVTDLADALPDLPEQVRDVLLLRNPAGALNVHGWNAYPDPGAAQARLVRLAAQSDSRTDLTALIHAGLGPAGVREFPWPALLGRFMTAVNSRGYRRTLAAVTQEQQRVFTGNPAAWEVFTAIADTFDGTFGALLDTAEAATF
jgi:hypothetical protein